MPTTAMLSTFAPSSRTPPALWDGAAVWQDWLGGRERCWCPVINRRPLPILPPPHSQWRSGRDLPWYPPIGCRRRLSHRKPRRRPAARERGPGWIRLSWLCPAISRWLWRRKGWCILSTSFHETLIWRGITQIWYIISLILGIIRVRTRLYKSCLQKNTWIILWVFSLNKVTAIVKSLTISFKRGWSLRRTILASQHWILLSSDIGRLYSCSLVISFFIVLWLYKFTKRQQLGRLFTRSQLSANFPRLST